MNKCDYFERLISDRLDSSLSPGEEVKLQDHLQTCEACGSFLKTITKQRELLQALPDINADSLPLLLGAGETVTKKEVKGIWRRRVSLPMPAVAALLLVLVTGWLLAFSGGNKNQEGKSASSADMQYVVTMRLKPAKVVLVDTTTQRKESF
jgi:predicted anti-sigma-YlaC factor YlaD